jgi:hypothetical protein
MATLKQIQANYRNAQKSTGPKTPEGKAAVRLNALHHGLRARTAVLPGESGRELKRLCRELEAEWQPQSRTEQVYVEQMALSVWKLRRMDEAEARLQLIPDGSSKSELAFLTTLWQATARLERSFARAQRDLERLQNSRRQAPQVPEAEPSWVVRVHKSKEVEASMPTMAKEEFSSFGGGET